MIMKMTSLITTLVEIAIRVRWVGSLGWSLQLVKRSITVGVECVDT